MTDAEIDLSCQIYVMKPSSEDWSKFTILAFALKGHGPGGTFILRIRENNNFRFVFLEDSLSIWRIYEASLRDLPGTPEFDWKNITHLDFEVDTLGEIKIDSIWLLGCPWLKASCVIRNKSFKNCSCSAFLQGTKDLPAFFDIPFFKNLSVEAFLFYKSEDDLPSILEVKNIGIDEFTCSVEIKGSSSSNLSFSGNIKNESYSNISSNCSIYYPGLTSLSVSCFIGRFIDLSCNLWVRRSLSYADISEIGPSNLSEVI